MTSFQAASLRALVPSAVLGASLALLASLAQAQTAPRYTARELPKVSASVTCGIGVAMNETGDVSQNCLYNAGSYSTTQDVCYDYLGFCYKARITRQITYLTPAVWPANGGSARSLITSVRSYSTGAIGADGAVVGRSGPIGARGESIGPSQIVRWLPPYSAAPEVVAVPPALQREAYVSFLGRTKAGGIWWADSSETRHAVVGVDGRIWFVPAPPALNNPDETVDSQVVLAVQDGLQALRGRWIAQSLPDGSFALRYEAWYLRDQQWMRIPLSSDRTAIDSATIAGNGVVLYSQGGVSHTWRADQPGQVNALTSPVGAGSSARVINASGLVGGSVPIPNDKNSRTKAQLWWQGQALDLQGRVTGLPSNWQLRSVEAINDRGQLVVQAEQTSIFSSSNPVYKTVLLTPQ
jgi:hypothetical protein